MMSFTSEMHLPQHCQIGLIHTGIAALDVYVCLVCEYGFACGKIVWGCQTCYPVIYQDVLYLHVCICVCLKAYAYLCICATPQIGCLVFIGMLNCCVLGKRRSHLSTAGPNLQLHSLISYSLMGNGVHTNAHTSVFCQQPVQKKKINMQDVVLDSSEGVKYFHIHGTHGHRRCHLSQIWHL